MENRCESWIVSLISMHSLTSVMVQVNHHLAWSQVKQAGHDVPRWELLEEDAKDNAHSGSEDYASEDSE